jgi:adenine-specific DNA-methyltransferase
VLDGPYTQVGTAQIALLLGDPKVFPYPKPSELVRHLIRYGHPSTEFIVLDFFAGSGSTADAVMSENAADGGKRRYLLVQLPQALDIRNSNEKPAVEFLDSLVKPRNISEITKERLRRAGKKIRDENPLFTGDVGFRVFKLDSTNINAWDPDRENIAQSLLDSMEHTKPGRSDGDLIYELLLKLGLDLCVPIEQRVVAGQVVHSIGAGTLIVCLATKISRDDAEPLALGIIEWHKQLNPAGESTVVFRDSAFADDVSKTNLATILQQHGLENVRSL